MSRPFAVLIAAALAAAALLCSAPAALAQPSMARETAAEMLQVYRVFRAKGLVDAEERCWAEAKLSAKSPQQQALQCVRVLISGGIIDQAMQISERRGPTPALTGPIQRERFLARTAAMGMDERTANGVMALGLREMPLIVEGLQQAGLR